MFIPYFLQIFYTMKNSIEKILLEKNIIQLVIQHYIITKMLWNVSLKMFKLIFDWKNYFYHILYFYTSIMSLLIILVLIPKIIQKLLLLILHIFFLIFFYFINSINLHLHLNLLITMEKYYQLFHYFSSLKFTNSKFHY